MTDEGVTQEVTDEDAEASTATSAFAGCVADLMDDQANAMICALVPNALLTALQPLASMWTMAGMAAAVKDPEWAQAWVTALEKELEVSKLADSLMLYMTVDEIPS